MSQPYGWTSQWFYQFLISPSALLHMLCEIQSSTSKGSLPLKGRMLSACKHRSDLIKFDFLISVVKPVLCLWANMAGISISTCIWPNINASQKRHLSFPTMHVFPVFPISSFSFLCFTSFVHTNTLIRLFIFGFSALNIFLLSLSRVQSFNCKLRGKVESQ